MKVGELGEFNLIERLARLLAEEHGGTAPGLLIGIGDDAAAWKTSGSVQLLTTDTLVQDVHFRLGSCTWRELGWKALAVNLSDIAAMGGVPQYVVVTLGLPKATQVEDILELYRGMMDVGKGFDTAVVGGDIVASDVLFVTVALTGHSLPGRRRLLLRSGARPGDVVAVTGYLGSSAGGLKVLSEGCHVDETMATVLKEAHCRPVPRVREGQMAAQQGVRCAIDISDGLVGDLGHVCKASGVAARVWAHKVPVHPFLKQAFPQDCLELALTGGEDYELLFTATPAKIEGLQQSVACPMSVIGEITSGPPGQVEVVDAHNKSLFLRKSGWDHLK